MFCCSCNGNPEIRFRTRAYRELMTLEYPEKRFPDVRLSGDSEITKQVGPYASDNVRVAIEEV